MGNIEYGFNTTHWGKFSAFYWSASTWIFIFGPYCLFGKKTLLLLWVHRGSGHNKKCKLPWASLPWQVRLKILPFRFWYKWHSPSRDLFVLRPQCVGHSSSGLFMIESLNWYSFGHLCVWCLLEHDKQDIICFCLQMGFSSEF